MAVPALNGQNGYPLPGRQAAGLVDGIHTDVMLFSFADKIMVIITQGGRLAQWVHVPLEHSDLNRPEHAVHPSATEGDLLPSTRLAAHNLLGAATPEREMMSQMYATQIANAIITTNPEESRTVVVGFGMEKAEANREQFFDLLEIVMKCL